MKSKVAITLDSALLRRIDELAKHGNRSNVIEDLIRFSLDSTKIRTAILLAGGKGARLRPLTYELPKPLVPIKDRPMIRWQIDMLRKAGIENIIVAAGVMGEKVKKELPDDVICLIEAGPLGTGGALNLAREYVYDDFVVMNADTLFSPAPNIEGMAEFHRARKNTATVLVAMKPDVSRYGSIEVSDDGRIADFIEKKQGGGGLISAGLYIFSPAIFDAIQQLPPVFNLEEALFPLLKDRGLLYSYFFNGRTFDIGTMDGYEKAILEWQP